MQAMNSPNPWKIFLDVAGRLAHLTSPIFDVMKPVAEAPIEVVSEGLEHMEHKTGSSTLRDPAGFKT